VDSFAQTVYDKLAPVQETDQENGGALETLVSGISVPMQEVDDYASEVGTRPPWAVLFDLNAIPPKGLDWLAQFVGVSFKAGVSDADKRSAILSTSGFQRGTLAAISAAPLPYLTGSKLMIVTERDGDPYRLTVITYASQTPDPDAVRSALLSQKPAGIVLNYQVFLGQTYAQLLTNHPTYANVYSTYATYQLLATDLGDGTPTTPDLGSFGLGAYGAGPYGE
jgi:hypothetical protein